MLATWTAPAHAETRRFHDPNESSTINDTSEVVVRLTSGPQRSRERLLVKVHAGNVLPTDFFDLWVDLPEVATDLHARIRPGAGHGPLRMVAGFGRTGPVACRRWEGGAAPGRHTLVVFSLPSRCLGHPGRVRVATRSTYVYDQGRQRDWVPRARTFTPWLRAG